ncbi:MAG: Ig-like domain-containing protein [Bacteroidales bacterium]|nr:Ig-like domain-containing protein [Bacteroidales bacterium]
MFVFNPKRLFSGNSQSLFVIIFNFFLIFQLTFAIDAKAQNFSGGDLHSLGLKADGTVICWGGNTCGQCNVTVPNSGFVAVAAGGYHSVGLKSDGSVICWGNNTCHQCEVPLSNTGFVAVSAGLYHSVGLKADGTVVCWGYNVFNQCDVPSPNSRFVAIDAGARFTVGLKADGTIVCWGQNSLAQCNVPSPNSGFISVKAGYDHTIGLKSDGSVVCWGNNMFGQSNPPSPNSGFVAVKGGYNFSICMKSDSSVLCWGDYFYGQCDVPLPNGSFVAINAGYSFSAGMKSDHSLVYWGINTDGQCNIPTPNSGFRQIEPPVAMAAGKITGTSFTARWNSVFTAKGYLLDVSTQPDFSVCDVLNNMNISGRNNISFPVTGLSPGTNYYYRVKAYNDFEISHNSVTISTVTNQVQSQVIKFNPLPVVTYGDAAFKAVATGGASGNPVVFTSSDNTVATCSGTNGSVITILKAGSCTIYADQAGNENYNPAPQAEQVLTILPKEVTVCGLTASGKIYDGNVNCILSACKTDGVINTDSIGLFSGIGCFKDKHAAAEKPVTLSGFLLTGKDSAKYKLILPDGLTASIEKAPLIIGITAQDKLYDGNSNVLAEPFVISGLITGDNISLKIVNARFENSAVGNDKIVTAIISMEGSDAGNYTYNDTASTHANIMGAILPATIQTNPDAEYIRGGNPLTFIITYPEAISPDLAKPRLYLNGAGINEDFTMFTTDNITWICNWNPPVLGNGTIKIDAGFNDAAILHTVSGRTSVVLDNEKPGIMFPTLPATVTMSVNADIKIAFSEPVMPLWQDLTDAVSIREGSADGVEIPVTLSDISSGWITSFTIQAGLKCNMQYYLVVREVSFVDRAGNETAKAEKSFVTDSNPDSPVVQTLSENAVLCPNDLLTVANFCRSYSYQWFYEGNPVDGENGPQFRLPADGSGYYTVGVVNPVTGCSSVSEGVQIQVYPVIIPEIYEKSEPGLVSILIVDNLADTYASYSWTYADGTPLPSDIVNNRQFLTLTGTELNEEYIVNVTDNNHCLVQSEVIKITGAEAAAVLYPTTGTGIFYLDIKHPQNGIIAIRVFNQAGVMVKEDRLIKSSIAETFTINMNGSPSGHYLVEVGLNGFKTVSKIFVK